MTSCKSKYREAADEILKEVPSTKNMNAGKAAYTLDVPKGWTTDGTTYSGVDVYFLKAPKTEEDPNTNINVVTEFMQNLEPDVYRAKSMQSLLKAISSANIIDTGSIYANGLKGLWYSYTMEPGGIKAFLINYAYSKDGVAYIITAGTQTKDSSRYRQTFDRVARSFRFSK